MIGEGVDWLGYDDETVRELRLVTELLVVAWMAPEALDQDVIDAALGIERAPRALGSRRGDDQTDA